MFNKKSFLIFLMFLFIVSVFNLFNEVTLEYVGISLNLYKEFEVKCGSVFEILCNIIILIIIYSFVISLKMPLAIKDVVARSQEYGG